MKYLNAVRLLMLISLALAAISVPSLSKAQSVIISGDDQVCLGETVSYTPDVSNSAFIYNWTVSPASAGTVLSGNYSGANIQWIALGTATLSLEIIDPSNPGTPLYTGSLLVTITALPEPYITSDVLLACQPLEETDRRKDPEFDNENCQLVCAYSHVTYTANGSPGSTFEWVVTGAVAFTPSGTTCTVEWGAAGFGQVIVKEITAAGCEAESSFCVEIIEKPTAYFKPLPEGEDVIIICRNGEVVLMDESVGSVDAPLVNWHWDWGDGHQTTTSPGSLSTPVSHQYTEAGEYTITLTVTNACGCTDSYSKVVRVRDKEAPKIACPRVVCEGETTTYKIGQNCAPDNWQVIGGTIVSATASIVNVRWNNVDPETGFGYVMYNTCHPCDMTVVEEVPVILNEGKINGPAVICKDQQYVYRMPKWPSTKFNWAVVSGPGVLEPTDQRNEIALTATGAGTIQLSVEYYNTVLGCGGSAQLTIKVHPQAIITGNAVFCQGESQIYNIGAPATWTLRNAAGTVIATTSATTPPFTFAHTFTNPGTYRLSATGASFCPPEDFFIKVIGTPPAPDEITGPDRVCAGIPTRYDAGNPISGTTYAWSISTAGVVNAVMGDYSYLTFTTFPATIQAVRLTTGEVQCPSAPLAKVVYNAVPDTPVITGESEPCHSTTESYNISYTEGDSYEWSIANPLLGSVVASDEHGATVLWNAPGATLTTAFTQLKLRIWKCGTPHEFSYDVTIKGMPEITSITLGSDEICSGEDAVINIATSFPIESADSYTWQWGDGPAVETTGFPGVAIPPSTYTFTHLYSTAGTGGTVAFTPAITIVNPNGCIGTVTATAPTISVLPSPVAFISPAGVISHCGTGWSETLTATETTGIGGSAAFSWSGPGSFTAATASITATVFGTYTVTVSNTVSGCSNTASAVISELCGPTPGSPCDPPPAVTLSPDIAPCGQIALTATTSATGGQWIVPDGVTISETPPPTETSLTATAAVAGVYNILYRVSYGEDCYYYYSINVTVPYVPDLRSAISCNMAGSNYEITLYDHSTVYPPGSGLSRKYYTESWTLIDEDVLEAAVFQAPNTTKTYYEVIQATGSAACTTEVTVATPVFPTTSLSVSAPHMPGCVNDVVFSFTHISTGSGLSYWWDFADDSYNASLMIPVGKVYSDPSSPFYNVTLKVTDEYGCYAIADHDVEVKPNDYAPAEIMAGANPVCQGIPVALTYVPDLLTSAIMADEIVWYEQTTPVATTTGAVYNATVPGGYWAEGHGAYGCKVTTNMEVVQVNQVPPVAISGNAGQCVDQPFTLTTQNLGSGYSYTWSGPGAASSAGPSLIYTIGTPGMYTYTVTITDMETGCARQSPPFTVTVSAPPAPPVLSFEVLSCQPYELRLTASGVPGTYNWSNGMSGTTILTPHGGPYQVTLTDLNGCRVQSSFNTPRSLEEYLWVFPTGCFCYQGINAPYVIGPLIPLNYWAWIKNGAPDVSGSGLMPDYYVHQGNVYNMELKNSWCYVVSGNMYYVSDTCTTLVGGRPAGDGGDSSQPAVARLSSNTANAMQVAPNPATMQVAVSYAFVPGSATRTIELYDITGRRLQSHAVSEESGSITLKLSDYAAGLYQVVMKRDGVVVARNRLSVSR